jgi:hypothetical protein
MNETWFWEKIDWLKNRVTELEIELVEVLYEDHYWNPWIYKGKTRERYFSKAEWIKKIHKEEP